MKSKSAGSFIIGVIAVAGVLALSVYPAIAVEAVYPIEHAKRTLSTRVWARVKGLFSASSAVAENRRLRREVAALSLMRADQERLESENARLRAALGFTERKPASWIAAEILAVGGGAAGVRAFLRVDCGSLDGVEKGAVVVVPEGLVGRVSSVTPHTAEITPITDPSVKVHCRAEDGVRIRGILTGGTEDALVLRSLQGSFSEGAPVSARVRILTSGLGGVFPAGIEIGTWIQYHTNENGVVTGEVLPAVDFPSLQEVFIRRAD